MPPPQIAIVRIFLFRDRTLRYSLNALLRRLSAHAYRWSIRSFSDLSPEASSSLFFLTVYLRFSSVSFRSPPACTGSLADQNRRNSGLPEIRRTDPSAFVNASRVGVPTE